jgi:hypothetical protein
MHPIDLLADLRPWEDLASDYNMLRGGLLPIGLAVLMFAPVDAVRKVTSLRPHKEASFLRVRRYLL